MSRPAAPALLLPPLLALLALLAAAPRRAGAQEMNLVAIGEARAQKAAIAFEDSSEAPLPGARAALAGRFLGVLRSDFRFYPQFFREAPPGEALYLGRAAFSPGGGGGAAYVLVLENTRTRETLLRAEGSFDGGGLAARAHDLADRVFRALTGGASVFKSEIVFVSDLGSTRERPVKELHVMDFDGGNKRRLTRHGAIVVSPAVSRDGKRVLYSLIRGRGRGRNVRLYVLDRDTGRSVLLSDRRGINSGAVFMPDGRDVLLTLSHEGNADIYRMDLGSGRLVPVTRDPALDVDPSIKGDGSLMAFLSGRTGEAHVHVLDPKAAEKDVRRISFVGRFNATPRFSPDGSEIAFSSWIDGRFDIVRIGHDGHGLVRLTKGFGSNEDPTWSGDGRLIAFSSQRVLSRRRAVHGIHVMTRDGEIIGERSLTEGYGNCTSPRWSGL